jgi:hypothetical protein
MELWDKPNASLVVCRGRRRIGKSTLIEEFARASGAALIKLEGLAPREGMTNELQLEAFGRQLGEQTKVGAIVPENWFEAFQALNSRLRRRSRTVVLLDEISWMGKYDPTFPGELKYAWENRFKKHPNHIFVLCGSVSSWIAENIVNSTAYFGRISRDLVVGELPLRDAVRFWGTKVERLSVREITDVLSVPFRKTSSRNGGCQIDLLLQTRKSVYVVEIKRKSEIGEEVEREVAEKVARLSIPRGISVRTALVYEGRLLPVVKANAYFDALVDISSLINDGLAK